MLNRIGHILPASLLLLTGVFQLFEGIAGMRRLTFFRTLPLHYPYHLSNRGFGWVNLVIGAVAIITALALFSGNVAVRAWAVLVALASAVASFFFLPRYPAWAILIIALAAATIWSLARAWEHAGREEHEQHRQQGATRYEPQYAGPSMGTRAGEPAHAGMGSTGMHAGREPDGRDWTRANEAIRREEQQRMPNRESQPSGRGPLSR
ncbi:MAG: hypothetical protein J2P15_04375 [Micromonosporaceae bacterium]|nr:hypothetical protein [Micromonosporaceae bacterium]